MQNPELQIAKEIVADPKIDAAKEITWFNRPAGHVAACWNFTKTLQEAEVGSMTEIDRLMRQSIDLTHLCGVHKKSQKKGAGIVPGFKWAQLKAEEMRDFFGVLWQHEQVLKSEPGLKDYIQFVFEGSVHKAGRSRRSLRMFLLDDVRRPWQTPEWYEQRKPIRVPVIPVTEFYPYLTAQPTEEHDLIMAVDRLVPKGLPNQTRADVCQDMLVAIITGEVSLENLKDAVPKYVKQFFKNFAPKYGHLSLDYPVRTGDDRTLKDLIAEY